MQTAIGLLELNSIAAGLQAADTMLKTANVNLMQARTICSGKYMVVIAGDVAAVTSSLQAGEAEWQSAVIDSIIIPRVDDSILPAVAGQTLVESVGAIGVIESFSVASLLEAADAAVKAANVEVMEIRLAMALGGKAFVTLTGEVSAVRAAVDAGAAVVAEKGLLVNKVVIAKPDKNLYKDYI